MRARWSGTVLVTGASRGIGRAVARGFAAAGARVVATGRSQEGLEETCGLAAEGSVTAYALDVRDGDAVQRGVAEIDELLGGIDVLVNNAGVFKTAPLLETSGDLWDEVIDTNLTGPYRLCRAVAPKMIERGRGGVFVQIASTAARVGYPGSGAYCASKFGLVGFGEAIREELRPHDIHVMQVLPGAVDTDAWVTSGLDLGAIGLERSTMMQPDDVAALIVSAVTQAGSTVPEELVLRPRNGPR